jgi:NAD+ diphosphatase
MKPSALPKYCPQCAAPLGERLVDERQRVACAAACGYVFWNNPVPVVAGLVSLGERIVLARNAHWPAGLFSMITGFLERGEAPVPALLRETEEELGLVGRRATLIGHYTFEEMNQLIIAFHVEAEGTLKPGAEIAETRVLERGEIAAYDFGRLWLTKRVVDDWLSGLGGRR